MKTTLLSSAIAFALAIPFSVLPVDAYASTNTNSVQANKILNFDVAGVPTLNQLQDAAFTNLMALSTAQAQAISRLKASNPNAQVSVNEMTGTVNAMTGMAIKTSGNSVENMARNFIADHQAIFEGLSNNQLQFNVNRSKPALGGQVVRFDQVVDGIKVEGNGVGVVIDANNNVRGVMGPYQKAFNLASQPDLTPEAAVLAASQNLLPFQKDIPTAALDVLTPAFEIIATKLGVFKTPMPELRFVQTSEGHSLVWQFYYYSTNPFGVFKYMVDAQSGEILYREDQVRTAEGDEPTDQFADYFPTFPPITPELQDNCEIVDKDGGLTGTPEGLLRIKLRKFDETNRVSGVQGVLSGKHALIGSALPTSTPFAQAALGTYYFDRDDAPISGRVDEKDHTTGEKVHFDGISQFIYITNLLEYLDYMHKEGDAVHQRGFGNSSGSFPDQYPNESTPLVGIVHIPNVLDAPQDPSDPEFLADLLNLDNAFAIPLSQDVAGEEVVVNPTFYGHGNLFNNLALDFSVPIHEGTHATITPIAGFEGSPEGGALNEGQADLWAYTIGETPDLGTYPVNACKLREVLREANVDPDSFEYIRSGQSQLRYSQLGTRDNTFQVHRDGEIYAGSMWDFRELMLEMFPANDFVRPDPVTGEATQVASLGKETWERIFLGSMYVLGVSAPDTFVKARDATLIADAMLYPADSRDSDSLGKHHALIERIFAARELGKNAQAPIGGVQMISTAVSDFTAGQEAPDTPRRVVADIVNQDSINVSWDSVDDVIGYQVLKRKGNSPARLFAGVAGREYIDGDLSSNGYTHVEFVTEPSYLDKGQGFGRGAGQGIEAFDFQYVVRAIKTNETGQVGFSDLSGTAKTKLKARNVTDDVQARISNVTFSLGEFTFDNTLTNNGSEALFGPINFDIVSISSPNVTATNANNSGSGQRGDRARFIYNEALALGMDSTARNLIFANPLAEIFSFKAKVFAKIEGQPRAAFGSQASNDTSEAADRSVVFHAISERKGLVAVGTTDILVAEGVDYVDVKFTALDSATSAIADLSADADVGGAYPDLDFSMLDSDGKVLSTSGNLGASEQVGSTVVGGDTYILRVKGYANGPTQFTIVLDQMVTEASDASDETSEAGSPADSGVELVEFVVNPLNGTIIKL